MDRKRRFFAACATALAVVVILALCLGGCGNPAGGVKAASDCRTERMRIAAAAVVCENSTGSFPRTVAEIAPAYLSPVPACPSGGTYTLRLGENGPEVTCSVHGM